ncbi:MAG TPA: hypothetical protein VEW93_05970 [Acidimicrobiales bacterium]|nr:hypothetical protein [Acidimicrobiales bacterium]
MSGTRLGVAFMVAGAILIVIGTLDVTGDDLIHTIATSLIVFGAVVLSVATEGQDELVS